MSRFSLRASRGKRDRTIVDLAREPPRLVLLFAELSRLVHRLEVGPQATVRVIGASTYTSHNLALSQPNLKLSQPSLVGRLNTASLRCLSAASDILDRVEQTHFAEQRAATTGLSSVRSVGAEARHLVDAATNLLVVGARKRRAGQTGDRLRTADGRRQDRIRIGHHCSQIGSGAELTH